MVPHDIHDLPPPVHRLWVRHCAILADIQLLHAPEDDTIEPPRAPEKLRVRNPMATQQIPENSNMARPGPPVHRPKDMRQVKIISPDIDPLLRIHAPQHRPSQRLPQRLPQPLPVPRFRSSRDVPPASGRHLQLYPDKPCIALDLRIRERKQSERGELGALGCADRPGRGGRGERALVPEGVEEEVCR